MSAGEFAETRRLGLLAPCRRTSLWRGVVAVCTLRAGHRGPCCWWAARKDAD